MATVRVCDASRLGSAVRETRLRAGLSQTELAAEAGVGRQWLVAFEAGDKASAPFDMVMRLLRALELEAVLDPSTPTRTPRRPAFSPTASEVLAGYEQRTSR
jgi:transcriptional regulator with XRE-family HTH domain